MRRSIVDTSGPTNRHAESDRGPSRSATTLAQTALAFGPSAPGAFMYGTTTLGCSALICDTMITSRCVDRLASESTSFLRYFHRRTPIPAAAYCPGLLAISIMPTAGRRSSGTYV